MSVTPVVATGLLLLLAAPVSAHLPDVITPGTVWKSWSFDPFVLFSLITMSALYFRGIARLWTRAGRGHGVSHANVLSFATGVAVLSIALVSPLDALGGTLLSAHMAQHGLLAGVAPPLLLMGKPGVAFAWGWTSRGVVSSIWRVSAGFARTLSGTMTAATVHGSTMWLWHAPALFGAAVEHDWVHAIQHASFLIPALLFWTAMLDQRPAAQTAAAAAAAFVTFMHTGLLGGLITLAPEPLYASYIGRTDAWGLTALSDQQLAGLFMWVPLGLPYAGVGLYLASRVVGSSSADHGLRTPVR